MNDVSVYVRCPARLAFLAMLRQTVVALCAPALEETTVYQVQLALSELVTNIVTHAYAGIPGGTIELVAWCAADRVVFDFYDAGRPFVLPDAPAAPLPDELTEGGYGLFLIRQTMDVVRCTREADDRNHWHLEKQIAVLVPQGGADDACDG